MKVNQHKFGAHVDCAFVSISSEFCLTSTLMNTFKSTSKVMDNSALPPLPTLSLHLIARNRSIFENILPHRYKNVDFPSFVVEG